MTVKSSQGINQFLAKYEVSTFIDKPPIEKHTEDAIKSDC